jgi:hypothetical protein
MNGRPALLWVAHQTPLPATDGGRQRTLALLHSLTGRIDVTVCGGSGSLGHEFV